MRKLASAKSFDFFGLYRVHEQAIVTVSKELACGGKIRKLYYHGCVIKPDCSPGNSGESGGFPIWVIVSIGVGAVLLLAVGFLVHRRKQARQQAAAGQYQLQSGELTQYNAPVFAQP